MDIVFHSANNLPVGQRQADGYVNASEMCKVHNKRFDNYKKSENYKPYLEAFSTSLKLSEVELVQSRQGKAGIWVHPRIAIHLAMWLSPNFAVEVIGWIETWMTIGQNPIARSQPQPQTPPDTQQLKSLPPAPGWKPEIWDKLPEEDKQHFSESQKQVDARLKRERADIDQFLDRCWYRRE